MSDGASIYFEADWVNASCTGPPDLMSTYADSNPSDVYNYIQDQFSYPACGMDPVPRPTGCCYTSLKTIETFDLQGMAVHLLDDTETELIAPPISANGFTYCLIESNGTFYNTYTMYVSQSGLCSHGFICDGDSLAVYDQDDCSGPAQTFQADVNTAISYNTSAYGNITLQYYTVLDGQMTYSWDGMIPGNILVPDHRYTIDKLALIGYIFAIGGSIAALIIYAQKLYIRQSTHNILGFSSQVAWLIEHTQTIILDYLLFPTQYSVLVYQAIFSFSTLASLLTVLIAIDLITKLFYCSTRVRQIAFGLTVVVHLALVGWTYLAFLAILEPDVFNLLIFNLSLLPVVWYIIMFVIDLFPPIIVMWKVFESTAHLERKLERWQIEVFVLVLIHILNTISYGVVGYLSSETEVLKNDRNLQNMWGINRFQFMLNCVIVLRFNVYLKRLLTTAAHSSMGSNIIDKNSMMNISVKIKAKSAFLERN
ncbi:hypothetical protein HDV01_000769 [Terramyces sp. JEL0728]|nr:hypothetical protein HDV01_000769 [Terramyces sp. JEL0728]